MSLTTPQILQGTIIDGMGIGAKKVTLLLKTLPQKRIKELFRTTELFPGTLNIQLESQWQGNKNKGMYIYKEEYGGDAGVWVYPCTLNHNDRSIHAFIVRPEATTHDKAIVEVVAGVYLRQELHIKNSNDIIVIVEQE
jgi:CTP-dependent riboflavin kinase